MFKNTVDLIGFIGKNAEATRKASVQAFEASLAFIDRVTSGHSQH